MEGGHSGAQQDSEREDINCAVGQLGPRLLCYCVITGLHHVMSNWETFGAAAPGPAHRQAAAS